MTDRHDGCSGCGCLVGCLFWLLLAATAGGVFWLVWRTL